MPKEKEKKPVSMIWQWQNSFIGSGEQRGYSAIELKLINTFLCYANGSSLEFYPSFNTIVSGCGLVRRNSESRVSRALSKLETVRRIIKTLEKGDARRRTSTTRKLLFTEKMEQWHSVHFVRIDGKVYRTSRTDILRTKCTDQIRTSRTDILRTKCTPEGDVEGDLEQDKRTASQKNENSERASALSRSDNDEPWCYAKVDIIQGLRSFRLRGKVIYGADAEHAGRLFIKLLIKEHFGEKVGYGLALDLSSPKCRNEIMGDDPRIDDWLSSTDNLIEDEFGDEYRRLVRTLRKPAKPEEATPSVNGNGRHKKNNGVYDPDDPAAFLRKGK